MKKLLTIISLGIISFAGLATAQDVTFEVIPESNNNNLGQTVKSVGKGGSVWDNYKDTAYGEERLSEDGSRSRAGSDLSLGDQFASGIMTWDTILDYAVYLVKFIGQLALLVGALMIIYLGYKKATEHLKFNGKLGKVVIGILVISFAYVIVKIIWSMFIS